MGFDDRHMMKLARGVGKALGNSPQFNRRHSQEQLRVLRPPDELVNHAPPALGRTVFLVIEIVGT